MGRITVALLSWGSGGADLHLRGKGGIAVDACNGNCVHACMCVHVHGCTCVSICTFYAHLNLSICVCVYLQCVRICVTCGLFNLIWTAFFKGCVCTCARERVCLQRLWWCVLLRVCHGLVTWYMCFWFSCIHSMVVHTNLYVFVSLGASVHRPNLHLPTPMLNYLSH